MLDYLIGGLIGFNLLAVFIAGFSRAGRDPRPHEFGSSPMETSKLCPQRPGL